MVREEGLEPSHPFGHRNLNPARLPIPPLARVAGKANGIPGDPAALNRRVAHRYHRVAVESTDRW